MNKEIAEAISGVISKFDSLDIAALMIVFFGGVCAVLYVWSELF